MKVISLRALAPAVASVMLVLLAGTATAELKNYNIDASHSRIMFDVSHLGFSVMPGIFREFDVDLSYDEQRPERSTLAVTIKTDSIDMFHDKLNAHLKNADFFDVKQHPTMTFRSTKVEPGADGTARVTGDFTLLGKTMPLVLQVQLNQQGTHPMRRAAWIGFNASGELDRTEFGMDKYAPGIGAQIKFRITTEGGLK